MCGCTWQRVELRVFGALTTWQRVLFSAMVIGAVVLNVVYVHYLASKVAVANANPESRVSKRTDVPFPPFQLYAMAYSTFGDACDVTAVTLLYTSSAGPVPVPVPLPDGLSAGLYPLPALYRVSGKAARGIAAAVPTQALSTLDHSVILLLTASSASTIAGTGACEYFNIVITSVDDNPISAQSHDRLTPFTVRSDEWWTLALSASADEDTRPGGVTTYHVTGKGAVGSRIPPLYGPNVTLALAFYANAGLLSPTIDWNVILVAYTWTDAVAAFFTLLSASVACVTMVFPLAAQAIHQRMFYWDVRKVGDSRAHAPVDPLSGSVNGGDTGVALLRS